MLSPAGQELQARVYTVSHSCVCFTLSGLCDCRSDLEKAISTHGGPSVVAQQLGWKLKAKGRWVDWPGRCGWLAGWPDGRMI